MSKEMRETEKREKERNAERTCSNFALSSRTEGTARHFLLAPTQSEGWISELGTTYTAVKGKSESVFESSRARPEERGLSSPCIEECDREGGSCPWSRRQSWRRRETRRGGNRSVSTFRSVRGKRRGNETVSSVRVERAREGKSRERKTSWV